MINRRDFLSKMAMVPFLQLLPKVALAQHSQTDDETYWENISQQFPITKNKIYFNNGTMGPSPQVVIDRLVEKINLVDSSGEYGQTDESRKKIADFIGANADEICLTHNTTEGINIVCWGLELKKGDEVLLTNHEHVGGALPWLNRAKVQGIRVGFFELGATAQATFNNLQQKISRSTKVIALPHITCTTGQLLPIKMVSDWAKTKGIKVVVDGAHGTGMLALDMEDLGVDYYAACCHKWLCAPKGTAFLYVRKIAQNSMQPLFVGAESDSGWNVNLPPKPNITGYTDSAHRYDYGTQNTALWQGANAAIDFWNEIGLQKIENRCRELATYFMEKLRENKNYSILTPSESISYAGMVSFKPLHQSHTECMDKLYKEKLRLRLVAEHELNCIRASFHIYNLKKQIDRLLEVL